MPLTRSRSESVRESFYSGRDTRNSLYRSSAIEVYELVYGTRSIPAASVQSALERLYEPNAVYENPLVTATSRAVISDIHSVTRQLAELDVPRPHAWFSTLFRGTPLSDKDPWFEAVRVWSEIGEVCESESFDGNHQTIIEHDIQILLLPGLHSTKVRSHDLSESSLENASTTSLHTHSYPHHARHSLALPIPGASSLPSPLHFELKVITRLSFNEQGRVAAHRDFWDLKEIVGLLPGAHAAQWIATRVAARSLQGAAKVVSWLFAPGKRKGVGDNNEETPNALGLLGVESLTHTSTSHPSVHSVGKSRAPDIDRD